MLAENVEGIANATETVEMLNQAQENLQEVAKNPGIVGTWLQGLIPDLLNLLGSGFASGRLSLIRLYSFSW